ncbi:MAG: 4a-hydroxytetrahydrobiopterin dehydratase [Candidatus Poseidoniaceae archaeon]|nr:4a-hydroxytetrahydrobiopterin dehydratase [Candidatus Poseidoniaceae archaeon]
MTPTCGGEILASEEWELVDNHHLRRSFLFPDFLTALDFVNQVGAICEQMDHHADLELSWGKVVVKTWTHSVGKVTELDHELAAAIDSLG